MTAALRKLLREEEADPELPVATVLCKAYHHPSRVCGELAKLTAADVQRDREL